jgi:hypothetical protein
LQIYDDTSDATRMIISTWGDVWFWSVTPVSKLDVKATVPVITAHTSAFTNTYDWMWFAAYQSVAGRQAWDLWNIVADSDSWGGSATDYQTARMVFNMRKEAADTSLTEVMRIDTDGNVWIWTDNPGAKLHVAVGAVSEAIKISGKSDNSVDGMLGYSNGSWTYLWMENEAGSATTLIRSYGSSYFTGGNFWIWINVPVARLQVQESLDNSTSWYTDSWTTAFIQNTHASWVASLKLTGNNVGRIVYGNGNATLDKLHISSRFAAADALKATTFDPNWKVGFGTATPWQRVTIQQSADGENDWIGILNTAVTNAGKIWMSGTSLHLKASILTSQLVLASNWYVWINSNSPWSQLSVIWLPTSNSWLGTWDMFTQTATQLGWSGTQKVVCIV